MKTLKFIVDGQILKPDPECDFSGLVPGTENYLNAKFSFSSDWRNTTKVVAFYSRMGVEYPPQILDSTGTCIIPSEALKSEYFKIKVLGQRSDGTKIPTNTLEICQNGG